MTIAFSFFSFLECKNFTGKAQITFREAGCSGEAVSKFDSTEFKGQIITVRTTSQERHKEGFPIQNTEQTKKRKKSHVCETVNTEGPNQKKSKPEIFYDSKLTDCDFPNSEEFENDVIPRLNDSKVKSDDSKESDDSKVKIHYEEKVVKEYHQEQKGRIVVKNVPSQVMTSMFLYDAKF